MRAAWLVALAACGRIDFDPSDAASGTTDCLLFWKTGTIDFDPPVLIPELASSQRRGNPALFGSGLHLFFDDFGANNGDIWRADRRTENDPWVIAGPQTELDSAGAEGRATVAGDTVDLIFTSDRGGVMNLWYALRPGPPLVWSAPTQMYVGAINTSATEILDPQIRESGQRVFVSQTSATGQSIAYADRLSLTSNFAAPVVLSELQNSSAVGDPIVSIDQLVIVFSSGDTSAGNDIFYATRSAAGMAFGLPQLVTSVNAAGANDGDLEMSSDFCTMYLRSDRDGHDQIYVAHARVP